MRVRTTHIEEICDIMFDRLEDKVYVAELLDLLRSTAESDDVASAVTRNQSLIVSSLMKREALVLDVLKKGAAVNKQKNKELREILTAKQGDPLYRQYRYHVSLVQLLAMLGEGENQYIESICKKIYSCEYLLQVLVNDEYRERSEAFGAYLRFLHDIYLSEQCVLPMQHARPLDSDPRMWDTVQHCANSIAALKAAPMTKAGSELLMDVLIPFLTAFVRQHYHPSSLTEEPRDAAHNADTTSQNSGGFGFGDAGDQRTEDLKGSEVRARCERAFVPIAMDVAGMMFEAEAGNPFWGKGTRAKAIRLVVTILQQADLTPNASQKILLFVQDHGSTAAINGLMTPEQEMGIQLTVTPFGGDTAATDGNATGGWDSNTHKGASAASLLSLGSEGIQRAFNEAVGGEPKAKSHTGPSQSPALPWGTLNATSTPNFAGNAATAAGMSMMPSTGEMICPMCRLAGSIEHTFIDGNCPICMDVSVRLNVFTKCRHGVCVDCSGHKIDNRRRSEVMGGARKDEELTQMYRRFVLCTWIMYSDKNRDYGHECHLPHHEEKGEMRNGECFYLEEHDDGETILPCGGEFQRKIKLFAEDATGNPRDAGFQTLLRYLGFLQNILGDVGASDNDRELARVNTVTTLNLLSAIMHTNKCEQFKGLDYWDHTKQSHLDLADDITLLQTKMALAGASEHCINLMADDEDDVMKASLLFFMMLLDGGNTSVQDLVYESLKRQTTSTSLVRIRDELIRGVAALRQLQKSTASQQAQTISATPDGLPMDGTFTADHMRMLKGAFGTVSSAGELSMMSGDSSMVNDVDVDAEAIEEAKAINKEEFEWVMVCEL